MSDRNELKNILNKETLALLAKDKKTLDDWVEMELAKLKQKVKNNDVFNVDSISE
jgi:hypothetical protein